MLVSICLVLLHAYIIYLIRGGVDAWVQDWTWKSTIIDGLFAFELGCIAQELGVVLHNYGTITWAGFLFLLVVWQTISWEGFASSPVGYILELKFGSILRTAFMLLCSLGSYRHMKWIWRQELSGLHAGKGEEGCQYPFHQFSLPTLLLTEFVGSLVLGVLSEKILNNETLTNNDPYKYIRGCLMGLLVVGVVLLSMDVSGAMFNPTLAALLLGSCDGQSTVEHVAVYWVAPVVGTGVSVLLNNIQLHKQTKLKSS